MKSSLAFTAALLLVACTGVPSGTFGTLDDKLRSSAKAGAATTAVTILGSVNVAAEYGRLRVAAITDSPLYEGMESELNEGTLAIAPVNDGKFSLAIPEKAYLNDKEDPADPKKPISYRYIERWQLVVFNDVNGNGVYDSNLANDRKRENDSALAMQERYRLGYKAYKDSYKYSFLPMNDMKQGWILVQRNPGFQNGYHQDFSKVFNFTIPNALGQVNKIRPKAPAQ